MTKRSFLVLVLLAAGALALVPDAPSTANAPESARIACDQLQRPTVNGRVVSLTGTWSGGDGGTYWIRQIGSCLWWTGFSGTQDSVTLGRGFANAFFGTVTTSASGAQIFGYWADVPRGATFGSGTLTLLARPDSFGRYSSFKRLAQSGGFGGTSWKRIG